jgi:hypothetical protein
MPLIDHKMGGFKEGLKLFGKPKNQVISRVSGHTALRSTVLGSYVPIYKRKMRLTSALAKVNLIFLIRALGLFREY